MNTQLKKIKKILKQHYWEIATLSIFLISFDLLLKIPYLNFFLLPVVPSVFFFLFLFLLFRIPSLLLIKISLILFIFCFPLVVFRIIGIAETLAELVYIFLTVGLVKEFFVFLKKVRNENKN